MWESVIASEKFLLSTREFTLEYAEAIASVGDALETAFGVRPSTKWIEAHLNEINDIINGNLDKLDEL